MAIAACPTAPCHEYHVRACLEEQLAGLPHVTTFRDEFGNLHARYEHKSEGRDSFRLVAHMDHPGFVVDRSGTAPVLYFAGGVAQKYFAGKKIVFYGGEDHQPLGRAVINEVDFSRDLKRVKLEGAIPSAATFAMWDLPPTRCTKRLFISPSCDDLVQVSLLLALVRNLSLKGAAAKVCVLFTRAEEIGFAGAIAALKAKQPLPPMATISLEASQARGFARVEAGPIVRVGDRLSIFDSGTTHWLETAFRDLVMERPATIFQRLLMGGGTCEASVFCRAGWPTGAVCVALNNYHNMGPGNSVRSESISLRDWQGLHDFLYFLATKSRSRQAADDAVRDRFVRLEEKGLAALRGGSPPFQTA